MITMRSVAILILKEEKKKHWRRNLVEWYFISNKTDEHKWTTTNNGWPKILLPADLSVWHAHAFVFWKIIRS